MRRPGPRPYECVRRAWHSDRHQPIRGSLIKEIFRVANEIHSSSTKQNKEWQEKLPTVVLKAEEIMYSKANSEAEYMDLKTLWDRTNDAINTIIRRDEGSESGQFLQPCIEAALNLGCTPRRASRSQRNCHPRCYLVSSATELDHAATNCPSLVPHQSCLGSGIRTPLAPKNVAAAALPKGVPPTNSHRAYPLFYGNIPPKPVSNVLEPARGNAAPNLTCYEGSAVKNAAPEHSKTGCDLSLRLGPLSAAVPARGGTGTLSERGFPLFLGSNAYDPIGSFESADAEVTTRKRKASFDQPAAMEDQQFCLQPKLPFRRLTGL